MGRSIFDYRESVPFIITHEEKKEKIYIVLSLCFSFCSAMTLARRYIKRYIMDNKRYPPVLCCNVKRTIRMYGRRKDEGQKRKNAFFYV